GSGGPSRPSAYGCGWFCARAYLFAARPLTVATWGPGDTQVDVAFAYYTRSRAVARKHFHDLIRSDFRRDRRAAVNGPRIHQLSPLVEHVAAPVRALDAGRDRVCQDLLGHVVREARLLVDPGSNARAETVDRARRLELVPEHPRHRDLVQRAAAGG